MLICDTRENAWRCNSMIEHSAGVRRYLILSFEKNKHKYIGIQPKLETLILATVIMFLAISNLFFIKLLGVCC